MHGSIMANKEMLHKLKEELNEIKTFLIGNEPENSCNEINENCLKDTIQNNTQTIEECFSITCSIREILTGGKK